MSLKPESPLTSLMASLQAGFEAVISYGIYLAEDAVGLGRREAGA